MDGSAVNDRFELFEIMSYTSASVERGACVGMVAGVRVVDVVQSAASKEGGSGRRYIGVV